MIRAAVIGATGYAGAELVRILCGHPGVSLAMLVSRQDPGVAFSDIYPALAGITKLCCEPYSEAVVCDAADVVFTALPHKESMAIVPGLIAQGKKVVDLSADFRFRDPSVYEAWYEPHHAKDLLSRAVYGLPELYANDISRASLVGNPGCYPTSILLPLTPLIRESFVDIETIVADAKSGTSGAGRGPKQNTHFCEVNENFSAYSLAEHRHNPEIDAVLSDVAGTSVHIVFAPHLVPMNRGILSTIYVRVKESVSAEKIASCLESFFSNKPFVRICPPGRYPGTKQVRGTNYCDIGFKLADQSKWLILVSVIDNLVKGAAGQAVQNMNLMYGFPETAGLDQVPMLV